ncbi:bifunctional riboflavin kinase/FMN adenylyltransferase [Fictibacillus macauensis ZFHKF-1]|uniref:Riboflavin biosynthesis protein n=1 Tax=Fictibacillus macauensis ZFHKF-1 TaxID=1196324 RepID=I8AI42_9BACL|nr:bifunctional riboflavin kinase/FAD synthetase [Fictibacillus macauensis]EIT85124.1 bifunctional riboflavin kinase/FMN adenylyltransferase [Fictibacillus macauensis ZFHKF-1]
MKTITLSHPLQMMKHEQPRTVMALGYFDGIHKGHRKVIDTAIALAKQEDAVSAVMSFHPHPSVVLGKKQAHVSYITPLAMKKKLLEEMGVDLFYVVEFTPSFAALLPEEFIDQYLIGLNVHHVVAGFDYRFGQFGKGDMAMMAEKAAGAFSQTVIEKLEMNEQKVSSTLIRSLLQHGDVSDIPSYLGRPYTITGIVVHGESRGTSLGFPTANIGETDGYMIPANGVYVVSATVDGTEYHGVANIGTKPTFAGVREPSIEVHLFHFQKNIYGKHVEVTWHQRIRSEKKFNGVEELIEQIGKDKETALTFFHKTQASSCILDEKELM